MSSLYREYRPKVFEEVLGQDHIRVSLTTSLAKGLIGHAYLFSGPRGTGKTSIARLFARALNCPERQVANPCNSCPLCTEMNEGRSVDVIEIDAASNRGIDEIRELREKIAFAPSRAKYKVYIIDEVHMLTKEAFNALLKTLEEPPGHAVFILATTELHKVPETIISRCQRYSFHRAQNEALMGLLAKVAKQEKIKIDEAGLEAVIQRAEGSYRDALTLLGNLASYEGALDAATVRNLLGLPPREVVESILQQIIEGKVEPLTETIRSLLSTGSDLAILVKAVADNCKTEILTPSRQLPLTTVTTVMEQLLVMLAKARVATDPTAILVTHLVTLAMRYQQTAPKAVPVATPAMVDVQKVEKPKADEPTPVDAVAAAPTIKVEVSTASPEGQGSFWSQFLEKIKEHNHALYAVVRSAQLEGLTDETVVVAVKFQFYVDRLQELRNKKLLESVAAEISGRPLRLECVIRGDLDFPKPNDDDLVRTVVDVFELEEAKS